MPSYTRIQTGVGTTPYILLDTIQGAGNIALQTTVSGTVTYTVEHSNDPASYDFHTGARTPPANWISDANLVNKTTNADGNFIVPVQWCRLNVTAGTGTAILTVRQGGPAT
jgi:hypothetical protein